MKKIGKEAPSHYGSDPRTAHQDKVIDAKLRSGGTVPTKDFSRPKAKVGKKAGK